MAEANEGEGVEAAERYAQAAFDLAQEQNALDALDKDLTALLSAFKESADLREAAASPLIDPVEKAKAFVSVAGKLGLSQLGQNLVGVVVQNRRAAQLPAIARAFQTKYARHRGALRAQIISAHPLSDKQAQSITDALSAAMGKRVEAETSVDESLIGGFIVRTGSRQFDSSLKTKLANLKLALRQSA